MNNLDLTEEFPQKTGLIYLNHAAVSPWPKRCRDAVCDFADENMREGSLHFRSWIAKYAQLKERCSRLIVADSADDIAILKNTSEGLSLVARGIRWEKGDNVVFAAEEFPSNRYPWQSLSELGVEVRMVSIAGMENPESCLIAQIDDNTRLLSSSSVHYDTGLKMDLKILGEACRAHKALFCVDAIQSLGALSFDVNCAHADFVCADAHKWMLGPEGAALFYTKPQSREALQLNQYGWRMASNPFEFNQTNWTPAKSAQRFEAGSLNTLGAYGMEASLALIEDIGVHTIEIELLNRTRHLLTGLKSITGIKINSDEREERLSGIVNFSIANKKGPMMVESLHEIGIISMLRGPGIRLSPHFYTPMSAIDATLNAIEDLAS